MDPLAPMAGGTYRVEVAPASPGIGYDILVALLAVQTILLGLYLAYALSKPGGRDAVPFLTRIAWRRWLTVGLAAACALFFLWRVRDLLTPFLIAFFLASILDPVITNMQRHGISRGRAVGSLFALVFLVFLLGMIWIVPRASTQMQDLVGHISEYSQSLTQRADRFYAQYHTVLYKLGMKHPPSQFLSDRSGPVADATRNALDTVKNTLIGLAGKVLWLIIIPLSLIFFLLDYQAIRTKLISFVPERYQASVDKMSMEIIEIFSQYTRSLAKVCVLYGICAALIFYWLGLRHALLIGIAAGVFYAVPYVGPALTVASCGIIALTMNPVQIYPTPLILPPVAYAVLVVVCFGVMHVTFDYVITSRLVGGSVGLHPLINVFALMCGATLFGVWGMLLAVPVAASVQLLLVYFFPKLAEKPTLSAEAEAAAPPAEKEELNPRGTDAQQGVAATK